MRDMKASYVPFMVRVMKHSIAEQTVLFFYVYKWDWYPHHHFRLSSIGSPYH